MAKFKSTYNGFVIEFTNENDIAELRRHTGYIEVKEHTDGNEEKETGTDAHEGQNADADEKGQEEGLLNAQGAAKDSGRNTARKVRASSIPSSDPESGLSSETGVRGKRQGRKRKTA